MVVGSNPVAVTSPSDFAPASSKEFLDIQATIECGFTLKRVRDMIKTYNLLQGCLLPQSCNSCLCFLRSDEYCNVTDGRFECSNCFSICFLFNHFLRLKIITSAPVFSYVSFVISTIFIYTQNKTKK